MTSKATSIKISKKTLKLLHSAKGWYEYNMGENYSLDQAIELLCRDKFKQIQKGEKA